MSSANRPGLVAAWMWAALVVAVSAVVGIALFIQGRFEAEVFLFVLAAVAYSYLGLLIVVRQPGNRVAWLLFVVATWTAVTGLSQLRMINGPAPPNPVAVWDVLAIMWGNTGYFVGLLLPLLLFLYIFPTGRFLTRRWSWAGWVVGVLTPLALASQAFAVEVGPDDADWTVANPIGFLEGMGLDEGVVATVFGFGFVALGLGAVPAIIVRYRRADTAVRTQVKWVVYATLMMFGSVLMSIAFDTVLPDWASNLLFVVLLMAVPASVTVAITRYRLYEIDRIISRTLSYAVVVAVLGAVFVGTVALVTSVLPSQDSLAVAGSTLAVAAMFNPLRKWIQRAVDRRFNRSGYQIEVISEQFTARLRESLNTDEIVEVWGQTINNALQPEAIGVWIRQDPANPRPGEASST